MGFFSPKGALCKSFAILPMLPSLLILDCEHWCTRPLLPLSEDCSYDPDVLGYFLIVQPGDSIAIINAQIGFDILANKWTGIRFDQPGYTPSFEVLEGIDLG
ncbi:MAG: hypothetical protein PHQ58_17450 [Rhodoferax sp.]|nr:hypothetical protein [Rhodoferax sp.]